MSRLPNPGSDSGTWGAILNDFLKIEHNTDGTLKASGSLATKADDNTVVHNSGVETITGTKTFAAPPNVPTPTSNNHATTKAYVDSTVAAGAPDATTGSKGIVQLAGDLGGFGTAAAAPIITDGAITNSKIATGAVSTGKLAAGAVTSNEIADGTITNTDVSGSAAIAKSKLAALNIVDADVSAISESKVTNLTTDLAAKATDTAVVHKASTETITGDKDFTGALTHNSNAVVDTTRAINTSTGLTGGGNLTADRTLSVIADSTTQKVEVAKAGVLQGTRKQINLIEGSNVTITTSDNAGGNRVDVTVATTSGLTPAATVTDETTYGVAKATGTSTNYAREDHTHGSPSLTGSAPATTEGIGTAAAVGVATVPARADHVHPMAAAGAPVTSAVGDTQSTGAATTFAASDHRHAREAFGTVTPQTSFGSSSANGSAITIAHSDHTHGTPSLGTAVPIKLGTATAGSAVNASHEDHVHPNYEWAPYDHNLLAWSFSPTEVQVGAFLSAAGTLNVIRVHLPIAATVNNILVTLAALGGTLTSGQCFAGIYDTAGTLKATTADQSATWSGSTGNKTMALTGSVALAAADYYIGLVANGTTMPKFIQGGSFATVNIGLTASTARFGNAATGVTTALPGAMGTLSSSTNTFWVGLS
jgi:hypothetical protein